MPGLTGVTGRGRRRPAAGGGPRWTGWRACTRPPWRPLQTAAGPPCKAGDRPPSAPPRRPARTSCSARPAWTAAPPGVAPSGLGARRVSAACPASARPPPANALSILRQRACAGVECQEGLRWKGWRKRINGHLIRPRASRSPPLLPRLRGLGVRTLYQPRHPTALRLPEARRPPHRPVARQELLFIKGRPVLCPCLLRQSSTRRTLLVRSPCLPKPHPHPGTPLSLSRGRDVLWPAPEDLRENVRR